MKKRLFTSILTVSMILSCSAVSASDNEVKVYLDGTQLQFEQSPVIQDGRTLVPMRALFEALGAEVIWDGETQHAMGVAPGIVVEIDIGSPTMRRNAIDINIDVPAQIVNDRTMIPLRVVSESFGMNVDWNAEENSIYLYNKNIIQYLDWNDNYYYIGETQNGQASGYGALYSYETDQFDAIGIFNDSYILKGAMFMSDDPNGDVYVGDFVNGKMNGHGTYYFSNGDIYVGDFVNDQISGQGTYYYVHGDKYIGNFNNTQKNGQGTYYFVDGDIYIGNWINDQMNGQGEYYYANGEKYIGDNVNGQANGQGIFYYLNGDKYIGNWINGKRNGQGTYYYNNGYYIKGEWVDGNTDGLFEYYSPDGRFIEYRMYSKGVPIS